MKNTKKKAIVVVMIGLFLLLGYVLLTGRISVSDDDVKQGLNDVVVLARSRVEIGDSRADAVSSLSDAWFHSECTHTDFINDLFFFGPHDPDKVQIIIIRSRENHETSTVFFVGEVENYMLHLYDHCIPQPSQAFDN